MDFGNSMIYQLQNFATEMIYRVEKSYIEAFIILGTISLLLGTIHQLLKDNPVALFIVKVIELIAGIILLIIAFNYVNSILNSIAY